MKKVGVIAVVFCLGLSLFSCKNNACNDKADLDNIKADVKISRLEQSLFLVKDKEDAKSFMDNNPLFSSVFLQRSKYPSDTIIQGMLVKLATDPKLDTLYMDSEKAFANTDTLKGQFDEAFRHIKYYYPDFKEPEINTIITGMGSDLFVNDSLIVIGIDFFLGNQSKYRPAMLPEYVQKKYQKKYMVPLIIREVSRKYVEFDPLDNTLLAEMIWHGKALYFIKQMMPCVEDSILLGYTPEQMKGVTTHLPDIWNHFVSQKLLFETSHAKVNKYVTERPYTAEIGPKCPGMIGAYLGYEIVKKYMELNSDVTLAQLMANKDVKAIFSKSKFKPEK